MYVQQGLSTAGLLPGGLANAPGLPEAGCLAGCFAGCFAPAPARSGLTAPSNQSGLDPPDLAPPELNPQDWSRGAWEASVLTRLVRQRMHTDCGVACLAMVSGCTYEVAQAAFHLESLHLKRPKRPYASNFADLRAVLRVMGLSSRLRRWAGWDAFMALGALGILKVAPGSGVHNTRNWHWVVAEPHPAYGVVVRDPMSPLVSMKSPPMDVLLKDFERVRPQGGWIALDGFAILGRCGQDG